MCSDCVKCTLYAMMVDGKRSFYNLFKHLFLLFLLFVHLHISSTTISCCIYIKLGQRFRHVIFSFNGGARAHANEGVSRFSFAGALFVVDEYSMEKKSLFILCVVFVSIQKVWSLKFQVWMLSNGTWKTKPWKFATKLFKASIFFRCAKHHIHIQIQNEIKQKPSQLRFILIKC